MQLIVTSGNILFIVFLAICIYLFADPLLGFKVALVTFMGCFMITILKLFYKIPRPYWIDSGIQGKKCDLDFSGPSDHSFMITFFYTYITIIFFERYIEVPMHRLSIFFISLTVILWVLSTFALSYLGSTYIIESIVGGIYGFMFTLCMLYFDT